MAFRPENEERPLPSVSKWGPPGPGGRVITYFPQSGKDSHLFVLNGSFYKTFLKHKWHVW